MWNGVDLEMRTRTALSPLSLAVEFKTQLDTLILLQAFGADVEGGFKFNSSVTCTPLHRAVELRAEEPAVFLINSRADLRAADRGQQRDCATVSSLQRPHSGRATITETWSGPAYSTMRGAYYFMSCHKQ